MPARAFSMLGAAAAALALSGSAPGPSGPDASQECRWVESEYRDEVTVTTCNSVANIQVRFMSLGPGACSVEASSPAPGDRVGVTALPGVFTGWINMPVAHLGATTRKITNRVICDTGVRSQVRYSAPR